MIALANSRGYQQQQSQGNISSNYSDKTDTVAQEMAENASRIVSVYSVKTHPASDISLFV